MKPKDFIEKYNLKEGWKANKQTDFLNDMTSELMALVEMYHAENNIRGFENSINVISAKWNAISNKIPYGIPEKLWNYYFATVIAPLREALCPREMAIRKAEVERRKQAYEERKRERDNFDFLYGSMWGEYFNFWGNMFKRFIQVQEKPTKCFKTLGLNDDATEEDVKKVYRELVLVHHPDKGGKQEEFVKITDSKNKCIAWLHSHN